MGRLFAMILTAYDPRRNPAAGLLACQASHACELLVQLLRTADATTATAEDYTKKSGTVRNQLAGPEVTVCLAPGEFVRVPTAVM